MKTTIGILQGKQAKNNKLLLKTLYDNGPLSAWEMTRIIGRIDFSNRHSQHATYNKRLRILEKKGYVQKAGRKWVLHFKGFIAVLLIQSQPKPWNEEWNQIFENYTKPLREIPSKKYGITENGKEILNLTRFVIQVSNNLRRFEDVVALSKKIKTLMDEGFVNLDVIKNKSLLSLIITEFSEEE
jgi:DNA-binding PadR family transcriptional regulator